MGHRKKRDTPHLGADADVMAWRLRDKLQTGDVIVCLKIWWVGDGRHGCMNVFKIKQMMASSVRQDRVTHTVFLIDAMRLYLVQFMKTGWN